MAIVYILYSHKLDSFYTGSCLNLESRMKEHRAKTYADAYTRKADDCELFYKIEDLAYQQARGIEIHIKRMKSKKYINDLLKFPEISERLVIKYK